MAKVIVGDFTNLVVSREAVETHLRSIYRRDLVIFAARQIEFASSVRLVFQQTFRNSFTLFVIDLIITVNKQQRAGSVLLLLNA